MRQVSGLRFSPNAYEYINRRLNTYWRGKPITPRTVRRELNSIQHIFVIAKEQWGFTNLANRFGRIPIKGSTHRRKRRLKEGELERIMKACQDCRGLNEYYVPLAVRLAIETGMRLQEIFNLTWQDMDAVNRRIEIRKSKTDHLTGSVGRTIVLTFYAGMFLNWLGVQLLLAGRHQLNKPIFPVSKGAFQQSWADVLKRADVKDLTFHDLRHEAASRFDEAGLTKAEHDLMMGHASRDMATRYIHADLKSIENKLDRSQLAGMTWAEAEARMDANARIKARKFLREYARRIKGNINSPSLTS